MFPLIAPGDSRDSLRNRFRALVEFRVSDRLAERAGPRDTVVAELQAKRFLVSGSVQGVGFRFFAVRAAQRIGLAGYTLNLRDGRVEVYAIGAPDQLAALHHELERGPRGAIVSGVTQEAAEIIVRYADGFSIEYGP